MDVIEYTHCPCCNSHSIQFALKATDFTVSQTAFDIWHCNNCQNRFTQNIPTQQKIGAYYQSENYISHSDTSKGLINKLYHTVRKFTLSSKKNLINSVCLQKGSLLDVGAGTGAFASTMQQNGWQVTGLEPDKAARDIAKEKLGIELQAIENFYSLTPSKFNCITLWHVLEHVHSLQDYFKQFNTLLQPKGNLVIAVPNYTSYDAQYYKEFWAAYDVPRHLYHFAPNGMIALAAQHGFTIKKIKPMWFDSFYVSMLSQQYKTKKQGLIQAVFVGCISNIKALFNKKKCSSLIYVFEKSV